MPKLARNRHRARTHGGPEDSMTGWRLIAPALSLFQSHSEVVDGRRCFDGALRGAVAAEQHFRGAFALNGLGTLIEAHGWSEFKIWRQGDPKLKATRPSWLGCAAAM